MSSDEILKECEEAEAIMDSIDELREVVKAADGLNIDQKINAKANSGQRPSTVLKRRYEGYKVISDRVFYKQDRKTNDREPRDGEAWSGGFADNH